MTSRMQEPRRVALKRVRAGDALRIQNIEFRVLSRRRQRKLVILELESSDGDRATLIGHAHAET
ncbi:hypothetical protein [Arthrobacter sp. ok362]|uniref:hypothetical protein n=1 Tax=Arthrobacter sp. ok362 TaxID=1761745 RepID=UPI00088FD2EC|nr:hypothetical protein [Arthrobacter sp. ok362]SDL91601.1 hypothetical protein SAMN04487913_11777 [Arthrobacter sp. ok362]